MQRRGLVHRGQRAFTIALGVMCASMAIAGSASADVGGYIARVGTDWQPDPTLSGDGVFTQDATGDDPLRAVAITGNQLLVAGPTAGATSIVVKRRNANGGLDYSFGSSGQCIVNPTSGSEQVVGMAVTPEGKIIVGGITSVGLVSQFFVARLHAIGTIDTSFGVSGYGLLGSGIQGAVKDMVLQDNGKILVVGTLRQDVVVARFNADGTPDNTFNGTGLSRIAGNTGTAYSAAVDTLGRIVLAVVPTSGFTGLRVMRLTATGQLDAGLLGVGIVNVDVPTVTSEKAYAVATDSSNRIFVAGACAYGNGSPMARLSASGVIERTFFIPPFPLFPVPVDAYIRRIRITSNGVIAAHVTTDYWTNETYLSVSAHSIEDLIPTEATDFSLNGLSMWVDGLAIDALGRPVVVGSTL